MENDIDNKTTEHRSEKDFRINYLLMTDAYSLAINFSIFTLLLIWVIITDFTTAPVLKSVILSICALCSVCMFLKFTFYMFFPKRMENFRTFLENPSSSDSRRKRIYRFIFPLMLSLMLFAIFLAGIVQGANQMPEYMRNKLVLGGAIWLMVVPLLSQVKLSFIDGKVHFKLKVPKLELRLPKINSRTQVIILAVLGILIIISYHLVTRDSNFWMSIVASASVFLIGLGIIYLIIEQRMTEEKRARLRPVERSVLDGILTYGIAIVRIIGMYAGKDDLEVVAPSENNEEAVKKTESFAKTVIKEGLRIPQSSFQKDSAIRFIRLLDDMLGSLFSLQGRYPFVIEEYSDVATILSNLEAKQSSIKSAFYWAFLDTRTTASEHKELVQKRLAEVIKICDELAETTSRCLKRIPTSPEAVRKGNQ